MYSQDWSLARPLADIGIEPRIAIVQNTKGEIQYGYQN